MKGTFKKIIALIMTVALVATTITFTAGNTLKAEENPGESTATEQKAEPAPEPEKSEPATEKQEVVVESDKNDSSSEAAETAEASPEDSSAAVTGEEAVTEEEATEEEEEEEAMPAQSFSQTASNGITVRVSAPEGAFPEGTTMKVSAVSHSKAMSLAEGVVDDVSDAKGVDINFYKDGKEIQPKKNVTIKFSNVGVEGEEFGFYHFEGSSGEKIGSATSNTASGKNDEFSIYIVIGQDEEIEVRDALQLNVRFLNNASVDIHDRDTKFIEETDEQGNYTVNYTLPTIEGKTPETVEGEGANFTLSEDKTKITATVAPLPKNEDSDEVVQQTVSCVVKYTSGNANYKVEHWFEKPDAKADTPADQKYQKDASMDTVLSGEIETETAAAANSVEGYTAQEINQEYIKADGKTVVKVYYDCNEYFLTYNTMGGSYIKGKDIKHGGSVDIYKPGTKTLTCTTQEHTHTPATGTAKKNATSGCYKATKSGLSYKWTLNCNKTEHTHSDACYSTTAGNPTPTKEGFAFDGWYLDEGCTQAAPQNMENVKGDLTVYAKWTAANVNYTIVYYAENADDNGYSYVGSDVKQAKTGTTVSASGGSASGIDTANFTFKNGTSATVKGDGSTVVTAYYSRNVYTITWDGRYYKSSGYDNTGKTASLTAKYGSNITQKWKDVFNIPYPDYAWNFTTNNNDKFVNIDTMPSGNKTVHAFYFATTKVETMQYWLEGYSGQGVQTKTRNGVTYGLYKSINVKFNNLYDNSEFYEIIGYTKNGYDSSNPSGYKLGNSTTNGMTINFYYLSKTYPLELIGYKGAKIKTEQVKMGAQLSPYLTTPAAPVEGATFKGWFTDPEHQEANTITEMPQGLVLYADWNLPKHTITYKSEGETIKTEKIEYEKSPETFIPEREGYTFKGWYTAATGGEEFDINAPIVSDITVYAHWTAKSKVQYTVKFETVDGEEVSASYSDQGRVGSKVKADAVSATGDFAGYYPDAPSKTITLDQDASKNVITFKYSDKSDFDYRIVYKYEGKTIQTGEVVTVHQNQTRVVATDIPAGYQITGDQYKTVDLGFDKVTEVVFQLAPKEYTISYEDIKGAGWNGEAGCEHPSTYTCDQLVGNEITIDGVSRDGSIFLGWDFTATNADGTPARAVGEHNNENPVISEGTYGDLVFKAIWGKVVADDVEKTYDGQPLGIGTPQVDVPSYCQVGKIQYSKDGKAWQDNIPEWTDAGTYTTYIKVVINGYRNLTGTAQVKINKRDVTLESATDSKGYDGKPLTNKNVTVSGDGFAGNESATYNVTGSQTEKGESANSFTYTLTNGAKAGNYNITKKEGKLTVTGQKDVVVTIKEHGGEFTYDGTTKTVTGYDIVSISNASYTSKDFTFSGNASVSGRDAGTYEMQLKPGDFQNKNSNYDSVTFVVQDAQLKIKPISDKIIITAASNSSKKYDGKELTDDGYTYTPNILRDGDVLTAVVEGSQTDAGTSANKVVSWQVKRGEEDVTHNYTFGTPKDGTLEVLKRDVILTSDSASKVYDGKYLSKESVTVSGDGFVEGQGATYTDFASTMKIGSIANTYKYALNSNTKAGNYNITKKTGTLTIMSKDTPITIKANSNSKVYDGTPLVDPGFTYTQGILAEGDVLKVTVSGSAKDAGTVENTVTAWKVMRGDEDVTDCYKFSTPVAGSLTVEKRQVEFTSATDSKTYDGQPLTNHNVTVGGRDGFADGEGADFNVTGTITKAGSVKNAFTYTLKDGAKADNYIIKKTEGTLTVSKKGDVVVTITEHSGNYTYDGTEKTVTGYDVSISNELYKEADFSFSGKAEVKGTDVGTYDMQLKASDFTNNNEDFENVTFRIVDGKLQISKVETPITITANSNQKTYDGTALEDKGYTYTDGVLATGDKLTAVVRGSIRDAGTEVNEVVSYKVMRGDKDVTAFYTFGDSVNGELKVLPKALTIKSKDAEKEYDGTALTKHELTDTPAFAPGDSATFNYTGSQLEIGNSQNTFTCQLANGVNPDNYAISLEYGTLKVTKVQKPIVITAASQEKMYDGEPLTNGGFTYTQGVLRSGDVLSAEVKGEITDAGSTSNVVTSYKVMRGNLDVTKCYTFGDSVTGTLKVSKRNVTLTSATASKDYDGSALTDDTVTVTGDGFVKGQGLFAKDEGATYAVTGSQTIAGTSKNTFSYALNENTKAGNYNITKVEGSLTVNPIGTPITVTARSDSKIYDGTALTNGRFSFTKGVLLEGDELTAVVTGSQTDAGSSDNVVESYRVMRGKTDVTGCYSFTDSVKGTLEVTKRSVTLTSGSDSKTYDGTALTKNEVTVSGDGFAEGEGYTADVTGSQTEVGSSANAFEYALNEGTSADNYEITKAEGTLAVSELGGVVVQIRENSDIKVYNGQEQKVEGYTVESISDPKYKEKDFSFTGEAGHKVAKGTDKGEYDMGLVPEDFTNNNKNFKDVEFQIIDGQLTITQVEAVLQIKAGSAYKMYDGTELTCSDWTCTNKSALASGDELKVTTEGTITNFGDTVNTVKSYKVMRGTTDVTANYRFAESVDGALAITKRNVTLTSADDSWKYDGNAHFNNEVAAGGDGFVGEEGATYSNFPSITEVGTVANSFDYTLKGNTNAANYSISKTAGTLEIKPAENVTVHITGNVDTVTYNGSEQEVTGYSWTSTSRLVTEDDFTFNGTAVARGTDAGTYDMNLTAEMFSSSTNKFKSITFQIVRDGKLTITPVETAITIKAKSGSKMYDGSALTAGYEYNESALVNGDVLTAEVSGSQTNVGKSDNVVTSYVVKRGEKDVTANYRFNTSVKGELEVTKRSVSLTSATDSKTYDGTALKNHKVTVGGDGFAEGEGFTKHVTGSITEVGSTANAFTYSLNNGTLEENYIITKAEGTLTVTPVTTKLVITAGSAGKMYDGTELTCDTITYTENVLAKGDTVQATVSGGQTAAGTSANTIADYKIMNGTTDVTKNYSNISTVDGTLSVSKRNVTITSASQTWEYDGEEHSNSEATVSGDGFVEGEADNARGTGTITELGSADNTIAYDTHKGFNANNYIITETPGTLNVIEDSNEVVVTITGHKGAYEYDGTAKTVEGYEVSISKPSYKASYIKFSGTDKITKKNAGTYAMGLKAEDFSNSNKGFKNVRFVVTDGELEITPVSTNIVITAESASKKYDGTALEKNDFTYTEGVLVNGDTLTAVVEGSQTDAGTSANVVTSYAVMNGDRDVTGNYTFGDSVDGTLTVTKRAVTLTSATKAWTYDREEHSEPVVRATGDGWADGEGADYNVTGSIRNVGEKPNAFTYTLNDGTLADNYIITMDEGTLKINPVAGKVTVTITGNRGTAVYNGTEQEVTGYSIESDNELYTAADFSFTGTARAAGLDVGIYSMSMNPSDFVNTNTNFSEVEFTVVNGTLEITPIEKEIVVKARSAQKEYDGSALVNSGFTFTDDVLIGDDILTAVVTGSITNAGSAINTVESYKVMRGKTDVTGNYTFGKSVNGTLTVTPRPVTIKSQNGEKTYDGTALRKEAFDVTEGSLVSGETFIGSAYAERTEVGTSANTFTVAAGANTSLDNYSITKQNGELNVTKKGDVVVTITGNSDTVTYNGSEQSVDGYTWTASCNTADRTLYSESDFTFNGTAVASGTDAGNYMMNLKESDFANVNPNFENVKFVINDGKLTINPVSEEIEVVISEHSDTRAYTGSLQSVTGYDIELPKDSLYTRADFSKPAQDSPKATASGTLAGKYPMGLKATDFSNTSRNFTNVKFRIVDGELTITPADISIEIKAASESRKYNGQPLTNDGWSYTDNSGSLIEGDTIDVSVSGTVTNAGKTNNVPTVVIKRNGVDVTGSYKSVKGIKGELEVTKRDVTLTSATASKTYDGKALENHNVTVGGDGFAGNEGASFSGFQSITDPGSIRNVFSYQLSGGAVADNYNITKTEGTLTVNRINTPISIKADSASKTYDGTELTKGTYTYTENVLVAGDVLTATVEGSIKDAGTAANNVTSYRVMRGTTDVTDNYTFAASVPGELKITKRNVTLTSATDGWTYDGNVHSAERVAVSGDGFAGNEGASYSEFTTIKKAGTVDNEFKYELNRGTDADNYQITVVKGKLSVAKKNQVVVNITGHTATVPYNGQTQSVTGYDVSITDPLYSEASFRFKGNATASGLDVDTYAMGLKAADFENTDEDFDNVIFNVKDGSLVITPVSTPIVVTAASQSRMYNGEALENDGFTYTQNVLKSGDTVEATVTGSITDAGSTVNKVSGVKVTRDGKDVSGNYIFGENVDGTLIVTKRTVVLTSGNGSKTFDGTPLTNEDVAVSEDGFIDGEGFTADVTGTRTEVGTCDNEFTYELNEGTKAVNYNITTALGTLEVTPVTEKVTVTITENSGEFTYDGTLRTVKGYTFSADNRLYLEKYASFSGNAIVSGTYAGTYNMELKASDFRNTSPAFADVTFVIDDGQLKINPINKEILIKARSDSKMYDGTALKNAGYEVTENNVLVNGDKVVPVIRGSQTDAGTSDNVVSGYRIINGTTDVTECYSGVKTEKGTLEVTKRKVTLTSADDTKVYDGEALVNGNVTVGGDGFIGNEGAAFNVKGSQTEVGSSANEFGYTLNEGTKAGNYSISKTEGTLEVTAPGSVVVKIRENSGSKVYNGQEQSVTGYSIVGIDNPRYKASYFTGPAQDSAAATAKGTDAGTYDMNLKASDFRNNNRNFTDVTFQIIDGQLEITPVADEVTVTITGNSKTDETYNGELHSVSGYEISIDNNLYKAADISKPAQDSEAATASGVKADTYTMTLNARDFANISKNFTNVKFVVKPGKLVINPFEANVKITADNATRKYNGKALTKDSFTVSGSLVEGDQILAENVTVSGSQTDVGEGVNTVTAYRITRDGVDVTASYTGVTTATGKLTVKPRKVTLTSATDSKTYDGTALVNSNVTVGGDGFVSGEGASYDVTGSQLDVGTSDNEFTYALNDGTKADNYEIETVAGTLTVERVTTPITVTAASKSKMYDGTPLFDAGFSWTEGILAEGDVLTAVVEGTITDAGTVNNEVQSYKVMRGNTDVTGNYTFGTSVKGTLTVGQRSVTLTSATDSKTYDGSALTNDTVTVSGDGFIKGEGASYEVTGSQLKKGTSSNTFDYTLDGNTKAENYSITKVEGTLTVSADDSEVIVTVTEHGGDYEYDGTEKTVTGYDVSISNPLYSDTYFTFSGNAKVSGTDAGSYDMQLTAANFRNNSEEFTNVTFVIVDRQLTIRKKVINITVTAGSDSKKYDGTALTVAESTVAGDSPAPGQEIRVTTSGTITDAGTGDNLVDTIRVMDGNNDVTGNYEIVAEKVKGTLTIEKRDVTITSATDSKTYDGSALTKNEVTVTGDGFIEGEGYTTEFTGTQTEVGTSDNEFTYELKDGTKAGNYNIVVEKGKLSVTPVREKVTVTITEHSGTATYDGTVKTVTGYDFSADNELYRKDYVDFGGSASVSGTLAGTYDMELAAEDFANNSSNFTNVEFRIVDGTLEINPISKKLVITADSNKKVYDGQALTDAGYTYTENVLVSGDVLTATVEGTITDVGTADNAVKSYKVMRGETDVTKCYTGIRTSKGQLEVTPRPVTIKSESAARPYDKKPLKAETVNVTGGLGFAEGEGFEYSNFASITNVGSTPNTYDYAAAEGTKLSNYDITAEEGLLTVTRKGDVIVTITGHNNGDGDAYDRKAHTVKGYDVSIQGSDEYTEADFTFDGNNEVTRTDAGTTSMGMTEKNFSNNDEGFDVTFVVYDGYVKVNPITEETVVTITEHSKTDAVYNGRTQTINGYDISIPEGSLYSEDDFTKIGQNHEHATASGMIAAAYDMNILSDDFTNNNTNFTNVRFEVVDGQLVIAPVSDAITVKAKSGKKIYDGTALTNDGFRIEGTLVDGDILTAVVEGTQTDVGTGVNEVTSYIIRHGDIDVTDSYSGVTTANGNLEITARAVTLTSASDSKEYDGTALTAKSVKAEGFVEGEGATYDVTGSQLDVGESSNTFEYTLNGNTKKGNYEITVVPGNLKVKKNTNEIVVTADSDSMKYNGTALENAGFTYTDKVLAQGEVLTATVEGSRTKAGTSDNVVTSYKVMRGDTDVTEFYTFGKSIDGSLTVTKRNVTLTSATDSKVYDGEALENHNVAVSGDGFAAGEGATYNVTGSQLKQGTSKNTFTYALNEGTDAGNYNITTKEGTLTVSKKGKVTVTITEHSGQYTYDATEKTVNGYDVSISDPLYTADDFTFSGNAVVKGTNAGTYDMELTADDFVNNNENFDDVTFVINDGALVIEKKTITIQIKGDDESRTYNGEELTGGSTVYGESPVKGEIVVTTEGGITDVGETANKITDVRIMD
ncbi:MAG: InlB B-repeat-containing protein, partial [Clostridia bacterium]|nr:InlB B-repeat-containing protein [Clostridia bacterium]